jgi:uncharacterized protein Yka (UPF0111/DUF47 family)
VRFNFFPKDEQFFDLYGKMAAEIQAASRMLEQLLATDPPDLTQVDPIRDAEHRCDTLTHDAIQRLHRTFITPFDREDLYALATTLDTVMDAIDHTKKPVNPHAVEINRLENEADRVYQEAVRTLFEGETDAIMIIKWKEVYDNLERITDCCEDVANVIEGVVVKHG